MREWRPAELEHSDPLLLASLAASCFIGPPETAAAGFLRLAPMVSVPCPALASCCPSEREPDVAQRQLTSSPRCTSDPFSPGRNRRPPPATSALLLDRELCGS